MKQLLTALIAATMTSMFVTSTFAEDGKWSSNLLLKSDAEVELNNDWKVWKGKFKRATSYENTFPRHGNYFFQLSDTTKVTQDINVSEYASVIDNGKAKIKIGAWFALGKGTPECSLRAIYYDENASYLAEDSKIINCDAAKWTEQQMNKLIPPKTRTIMAEIRAITYKKCPYSTTQCKVMLDDAYFQLKH